MHDSTCLFASFSNAPQGRSILSFSYPISVIYKSESLSQMLGFYSTLEIITSSAMVCDIWISADVWACAMTVLRDIIVIAVSPLARI